MVDDPKTPGVDELVLDLNFVPTWARKPADENPYAAWRGGEETGLRGRERGDFRDRDDRRRGGERDFRRDRDRRFGPGGPPGPRRDSRDDRGSPRPAPAGAAAAPEHRQRREGSWAGREARPRIVDVSFLPERQRLGAAVHRIHASHRAYPLAELAHLFLGKPDFYLLKLEVLSSPSAPADLRLYECKECHVVSLDREAMVAHAAARHIELFFDVEEIRSEPPAGQFICVARCRHSGRLLGPPNHHGFNEALLELHGERFSHIPLDEYRRSLEMVHEPELIEQWKQEYSKQRVYRLKGQPERPPMKWIEARALLRNDLAPGLIRDCRRTVIPATVASELEDPELRRAARDAWTRESRFPMSLMIALRPAVRHMGLHLFKTGDNVSFVAAVAPTAINPDHAIAPIRSALTYLADHPGVTRDQMLNDLFPGREDNDPERAAVIGHLRWLVDKGHVIEFFNGTLSVPRHRSSQARDTGAPHPSAPVETALADAAPDGATPEA